MPPHEPNDTNPEPSKLLMQSGYQCTIVYADCRRV